MSLADKAQIENVSAEVFHISCQFPTKLKCPVIRTTESLFRYIVYCGGVLDDTALSNGNGKSHKDCSVV